MFQQLVQFVIAIQLVAIFWELCKINGQLKRRLPTTRESQPEDKPMRSVA